MNRIVLSGLVVAALAGLPTTGLAHGGQYRGPGDVVPPNPGGGGARTPGPSGPTTPGPSGPTTPGPSGPSTPGPSGPSTGGPAGPAGPAAGPRTPRGVDQGPDLTKWQFWWEFNKDPYLNLKDSIHATSTVTGSDEFFLGASKTENTKDTLKPSDNDIMNTVLPALARALEGTTNRDITSSCIVAMAKIGKNNDAKNVKILDTFKKHLSSSEQEIRETAALALGISQMAEKGNLKDLVDLATDTPDGRKLAGRSEVDDRTRSFASYALGLVVHASTDVAAKASAFDALRSQLADEKISSRNQKVSAINGMRLLKLNTASADDKEKKLLDDVVAALWNYYEKKLGKGEQLIQAHVPPAIAQLIGRGNSKVHQKFKDAFLKDLDLNNESKLSESMTQSCAIALGLLAERTKEDEKYVDALAQYVGKGKDHMTKYFSLIALGEIGGDKARGVLLDFFNKGNKATIKPWSAIAIGIMSFKAMKEGGQNASVDVEAGRQLQATLKEVSNPEAKGAIAIGLGLMKYTDAADDLRDLLVKNKSQDEVAGYLSIGLALMNDSKSMEDIRSIVKTSIRRPDLLKQSAIALGKLGDKTITDVLQEMLTGGDMNVAKLSAVATAYGFIGDRRTIDPLVKLLFDDKLTDLSRAFAAVALGGVADKEALPWNSKIACDMNYRAAVETLTNQSTGILDIL